MNKCYFLFVMFLAVAGLALGEDTDPFHFLPLENSATAELLTPSTTDTAVGSYSWDTAQTTDGNVSLKVDFTATAGWSYILNINILSGGDYAPTDLSGYQYIDFDLYGDSSGKTLYFKFFDAGGNSVYTILTIDFSGWQHFHLDRSSFTDEAGDTSVLWTDLIGLVLSNPDGGPMSIGFDNLVATNGQADPYHFLPLEENSTDEVLAVGSATEGSYSWDSTEKTDGTTSLIVDFTGTAGWSYVLNINTLSGGAYSPTDLSSYQYIAFDVYGDGSGKNIYFKFFDEGGNSVYTLLSINFTGWHHFHLDRGSFTLEAGSAQPLWTDLIGLVLSNPAGGPMTIQLDNLVATNTSEASQAQTLTAKNASITMDGDASDWDLSASTASRVDNSALGKSMAADVRYAWDATNLYVLIQEAGTASAAQEASTSGDYAASPWGYDGVALWIDLTNANNGQYAFNPWFAFSSTGKTGLWIARVNNADATLTSAPLSGGNVATGGTFTSHNRVIEAAIPWASIAANVETARQPSGGLVDAIAADYTFGSEPLLIENDWNGQSFIGGSQYVAPTGNDVNSVDVTLSAGEVINATRNWSLYR